MAMTATNKYELGEDLAGPSRECPPNEDGVPPDIPECNGCGRPLIKNDVVCPSCGHNDALPGADELVSEFVSLSRERDGLEGKLDRVKKRLAAIQQPILDEWADNGTQRITRNGLTVHVRNDFFCNRKGGISAEEMCRRLKACGLGHMVGVSYSAASLKSHVRELQEEGQVPEKLQEVLNYDTVPRLVAVAASR
jgi:hypothetical protein